MVDNESMRSCCVVGTPWRRSTDVYFLIDASVLPPFLGQDDSVGVLGRADGSTVLFADRSNGPRGSNVPWPQAWFPLRTVVEVRARFA